MRPFLRYVAFAGLVVVPGCFQYRPVGAPPSGAAVRVVLTSAMEVTTVGMGGTRQVHAGVFEVSGTVAAAAADTLAITLGELRAATGVLPVAPGRTALVPTLAIARIEQRKFEAGRTALAGLGALTILTTVMIVLIIRALVQPT